MANPDRIHSSGKIYTPDIESPLIRGVEDPRPWDLTRVVRQHMLPKSTLLDVGCGPAKKLIPHASYAEQIVGLDIWEDPLLKQRAEENVKRSGYGNISLVQGDAEKLPFLDGSFDVVTHILSPFDAKETFRVLKPGGWAILERTGEEDKKNFKDVFEYQQDLSRGYNTNHRIGTLAGRYTTDLFRAGFSSVSIQSGKWKTWYSREGLIKLFQETPTIRYFDAVMDIDFINEIERKFLREKGIETEQHRYLIIAQKPDEK